MEFWSYSYKPVEEALYNDTNDDKNITRITQEGGNLYVVEVETLLAGDQSRACFQPNPLPGGPKFHGKLVHGRTKIL